MNESKVLQIFVIQATNRHSAAPAEERMICQSVLSPNDKNVAACNDDVWHCFKFVKSVSNPLAISLHKREASHLLTMPMCNNNAALDNLVGGNMLILKDGSLFENAFRRENLGVNRMNSHYITVKRD